MRKPQSQPSLDPLTPEEREMLADWLRKDDYVDVLERVKKTSLGWRPRSANLY